ncbi:MAG: FecR domain-containing protein [Cyclobacteriaceae bacterium]
MGEFEKIRDKYFEGETSSAEDQEYMDFVDKGVSTDSGEKEFVGFIKKQQDLSLDENFDEALFEKLGIAERANSRRLWPLISGIAASILIFAAAYVFFADNNLQYESGLAQKIVTLEDGTLITMNKNSQLIVNEFSDEIRNVSLEGEAFFDVARDESRPFVISAGESTVRVLGTSFNIRNLKHEKNIEVAVSSGKVSFANNYDEVTLEREDMAIWEKGEPKIEKRTNLPNTTAWKSQTLEFQDARMEQVLKDLSRYYDIELQTNTSSIEDCRLNGTFENASIDEILSILEYSLNISHTRNGNNYVLSGKGCAIN